MSNRPISVVELSNKRCPSEHSVLKKQPGSAKKSLIQAFRTAGKKLGYLFRARKYFSPSYFLTLYKAQIRPSLEHCSHITAAPTTLSILDAVQRRAIRLIAAAVLWYLGSAFAVCSVIKKREGAFQNE
nr:unnamed protein product [Callosobruchus chinensis]